MKKRLIISVAVALVLSVVVFAHERPGDAVELRLSLIDRIEDAFARGDTETLVNMDHFARKVEENNQWLADYTSPEAKEEIGRRAREAGIDVSDLYQPLSSTTEDGLTGVRSEFGLDIAAFGICDIGEAFAGVECSAQLAYCMSGTTVGGDPDAAGVEWQLKAAELQCELEYEHCMNRVGQGANLCKTIAVILPG